MEKITNATYKLPLHPNGDKFTLTPVRVGHLNEIIDASNAVQSNIDDVNDALDVVTNALIGTPEEVTQLTGLTTGVTLNTKAGKIRLAANVGNLNTNTFTLTNNKITSSSVILLTIESSSPSADITDNVVYLVSNITNGSCSITIRAGSATNPPTEGIIKIHFLVIS
jgi:hypothetical protein